MMVYILTLILLESKRSLRNCERYLNSTSRNLKSQVKRVKTRVLKLKIPRKQVSPEKLMKLKYRLL